MLVTLINAVSVVLGTFLGLLLKKNLPSSFRTIVMTSSGLVTIVLGLGMASSANSTLGVLFALIIGGFIGFALKIEERIESFGNRFQKEGDEGSFGLATRHYRDGFILSTHQSAQSLESIHTFTSSIGSCGTDHAPTRGIGGAVDATTPFQRPNRHPAGEPVRSGNACRHH